ncbi:hypothetical protein HPP92_015925 [Vanilla planifolia]|uniref:Uncharacterized protein n=1 Tax=Vanilla planifolia TaxID=51239 RepID=A0A835QF72_VANPL|nr:hypothetical protein HPP92_015925 [Vanilla planifolia]
MEVWRRGKRKSRSSLAKWVPQRLGQLPTGQEPDALEATDGLSNRGVVGGQAPEKKKRGMTCCWRIRPRATNGGVKGFDWYE